MFEGQLSNTTCSHGDEVTAMVGCRAYSDRKRSKGVVAYRLTTKAGWLEKSRVRVSS